MDNITYLTFIFPGYFLPISLQMGVKSALVKRHCVEIYDFRAVVLQIGIIMKLLLSSINHVCPDLGQDMIFF